MSEILQGTTPSLKIKINTDDFLVSNVVKLEFAICQGNSVNIKGLSDVAVDTEDNAFTYTFTEEETLALTPSKPLRCQLRFMFGNGEIVGTSKMTFRVSDLLSEEVMTE